MKQGENPALIAVLKKIWQDIVQKLNSFLYVKPKKEVLGPSKEEITALRKEVSNTLFDVLSGNKTVLEAVSKFPKNTVDESVNVCFHILVHLEADKSEAKRS